MIAEQDAPLNPVDRLDRVFNDVAAMYQELWLVRQVEMPDDILSESFARFTERITILSRIAQEQASQHERDSRIRAREERARLAAVEQARIDAERTLAVAVAIPPPHPVEPVPEVIIIDPAPQVNRQVTQKRKPARKSVALKKMELVKTVDDPCCICMEKYTRVNSVTTSCGHSFCKSCYDRVEQTGLASHTRKVCCPICREGNPKITEYRARKGGNVVPPNPLRGNQGFPYDPFLVGGDISINT